MASGGFDPGDVAEAVAAKAAVRAGAWVWTKSASVIAKITKIRKSVSPEVKPGSPPVSRLLIIGAPGVGKTTTGKLFAGAFDDALSIPGAYVESLGVESYALRDAPHVHVTVPPGQPHRRYYWDAIDAEIASGKYSGIILISSYGYHSIGETNPLRRTKRRGNFMLKYLRESREQEILVLDHLVPQLNANKGKTWLLHFVTKQDLWWANDQEAINHYREREYGRKAKLIRPGDSNFKQEFAFGSIVIGNFTTSTGKVLARTTAGYDQEMQINSMQRFWETLDLLQQEHREV